MPAGMYRHLVTIEEPTESAESGDIAQTWSTYCVRNARIEPNTGRETTHRGQLRAEVTHVFRIRSDVATRAIKPSMRISYAGRLFHLLSVFDVNEERKEVELQAREIVAP